MKQKVTSLYLLLAILIASIVPVSFAQDDLSCSRLGTSEAVQTTLYNDFGFDISLNWVDFECNEAVEGSPIATGERYGVITTYDGHEFIIRNTAGELVGYYVVSTANNGVEVNLSDYAGLIPAWFGNDSIIEEEPAIVEEESTTQTIITLIPIDESVVPTEHCSADNGEEVTSVSFWNDTGTDNEIYLYWLNWDCVTEEELYVYPDDHYYEFYTTYVGHDFVFRNADGELLAYHKIVAEDADQWYPLSEIINVEITVIEGEAVDFNNYLESAVNAGRAEVGMAPIVQSPVLKQIAEIIASEFTPSDETFLETHGNASAYEATELFAAGASEFGYEGTTSAVVIHGEGLTEADIRGILDITLDYEGWYNEEISSYAIVQVGDVFVLIGSDVVEGATSVGATSVDDDEEWATFEYEEPATSTEPVAVTVTQPFDRTGDMTYTFHGVAGRVYGILYSSDEYDTYLYLDDANGVNLTYNDDGAGNLNSFIRFVPEVTADYVLRLDSFQEGASGEYTLQIAEPDSIIHGAIVAGQPFELPFPVEAGKSYIIDLSSTDFDTMLSVVDSAGAEVAYNDDFGGTTNSFVLFTATTTGTYTIVISGYGNGAGQYNLLTGSFK